MTKSEKFQHFIHLPLSALHHLLIQTKTQEIFASLSQRRKKVSRVLWMDEPVQTVNSIPYNIDGISVYKIKAKNSVLLLEALKDGRKWNKDSRTEWTGFASVRYRDCSGGYTCPNTESSFFKHFKYSDRTNFTMNGTCEYCSASGNHQSCLARKYIAFSNDKEAYVYHCDSHTCTAKDIHKRSTDTVKDVLSKGCNITLRQIQSMRILADLRSLKNWNEAKKECSESCKCKSIV